MGTAPNKRARQDKEQPKEKVHTCSRLYAFAQLTLAHRSQQTFLGEPVKVPASGSGGANTKPINTKSVQQYKIAYRFKEGNSAAVRKPVKVGSFL